MRIRFLLLFMLIFMQWAFCQKKSDSAFYFNETTWRPERVLKTDLFSYLYGDFPIIAEQELTERSSIEVGAGLLTSHFFDPLLLPLTLKHMEQSKNLNIGYSLQLTPKFYYGYGIYYSYFAFPLHFYHYPGQSTYFEIDWTAGRQWLIADHMVLDFSAGPGVGVEHSLDGKSSIFNVEQADNNFNIIIVRVSLKLGYRL